MEAAESATGRLDLGFDFGKQVRISSHDILGYALLTSSSLGQVFRLLSNYQRLITPVFALRVVRRQGRVDLVYQPLLSASHRLMRFLQEATTVSNHFELSRLLGATLSPYDIYLSIPRPLHARRYRELAPGRLHFGDVTPGLTLSFDAELLEAPVVMADHRAMEAAEQRCKVMLESMRPGRNWSDWCAMMLREAEDCQPSLDELAAFLNISSRTLGRYLDAEGESFRALSLGIRVERAQQMLSEPDTTVTRIAYRLGYADVASFVRSFRRETGQTPTGYRREQIGD